jgi:glycosyltransferase involved in cell wall biosynthesis
MSIAHRTERVTDGPLARLDERGWQVPAAELTMFAPRRTKHCVCVPVLNEGQRLRAQLVEMRAFTELADLIIADGGSTDGSTEPGFLRAHGVRTLVRLRTPEGLSAQLRAAYAHALREGYEGIVTIDGNHKDDPAAIPAFIRQLEAGADCIQGSRYVPGGRAVNTPWMRTLAIRLLHAPLISLASGFRYTDTTNGFRAYSRRLLLHPGVQPFREVFRRYELLWYMNVRAPQTGHRTMELPVTRRYPSRGRVPTKISSVRGNLRVLVSLLKAVSGALNPSWRSPR